MTSRSALKQDSALAVSVVDRKDLPRFLRSAPQEDLDLRIALLRINGADDSRHLPRGQAPNPDVNPSAVGRAGALKIPVIEWIHQPRDARMDGSLRATDPDRENR